jgi:hypothetical protein
MRPHFRYGIILAGILIFLVVAPLIVLYLMGVRYDFNEKRFERTGIISGRTSPRGAELYINGELRDTTPTTLRFLESGDYDVEVKKQGYFPWKKRLYVKSQYVTWLNPGKPALILFRSVPQKTNLQQGVLNLQAGMQKFVYGTTSDLYFGDINDPQNTKTLPLPLSFTALSIQGAPNTERLYIISDGRYYGIYDASANTITEFTQLVIDRQHQTSGKLQLSDGGKLFELRDSNLYELDWRKNERKLVISNVSSYFAADNAIYYLRTSGNNSVLIRAELPQGTEQILRENLPNFKQTELFLTSQNQLFILGDSTLYALSNDLKRIADSVSNVKVDLVGRKIIFATNNEINLYDIDSFVTHSVTRSSTQIKNPAVLPGLGWAFYINEGKLQTIEMDDRDRQNNYTFANVTENSKFFIDDEARNILLLDSGVITRLQIRQPTSLLLPTE